MITFWNISSANVTLIWGMLWVTVVFNLSRGCGLAMLKINPADRLLQAAVGQLGGIKCDN
jgi:hypothetical protein